MKYLALAVIALVIIAAYLTTYYLLINPGTSTTTAVNVRSTQSQYSIKVYINDEYVTSLTLSDLKKLRQYRFVDSLGKVQEGPLLKDVITKLLSINSFKYVVIKGRGQVKLNYEDVMNKENYIILDFTRKGTVKLCGREDVIPRNEWVKDVTIIKIYR